MVCSCFSHYPRAVISEIRWGGQPGGFGSPALQPSSSCISIMCLSDRYGLSWQNAGANTRLLWSGARQTHSPSRWAQLWRIDLLYAFLWTNNPYSLETKSVLRALPLQHWCSYILTLSECCENHLINIFLFPFINSTDQARSCEYTFLNNFKCSTVCFF